MYTGIWVVVVVGVGVGGVVVIVVVVVGVVVVGLGLGTGVGGVVVGPVYPVNVSTWTGPVGMSKEFKPIPLPVFVIICQPLNIVDGDGVGAGAGGGEGGVVKGVAMTVGTSTGGNATSV